MTTTLSLYYLPRIAEIKTPTELKKEIIKVYRFVMPIVLAGATAIYLVRDFIIQALFTADFLPMRELFSWQLAGDVVKIGSWVLAYVMLGRAMVKVFVMTEITFSISFVVLSWWFIAQYGLIGVSIGYAINYCCYWVGMGYLVKLEMRRMAK